MTKPPPGFRENQSISARVQAIEMIEHIRHGGKPNSLTTHLLLQKLLGVLDLTENELGTRESMINYVIDYCGTMGDDALESYYENVGEV